MKTNRFLIFLLYLFLIFLPTTESCLPSWFRQERSAEPLEGKNIQSVEETNEIEDVDKEKVTKITTNMAGINENSIGDDTVEGSTEYVEYEEEESEKIEKETKYNEDASTEKAPTRNSSEEKNILKMKIEVCQDYCEHNATCHAVETYHSGKIRVTPVCDCRPIHREGARCEFAYVQPFYAKASGNNQSSSPLPVLIMFFVMLGMLVSIIVFAYKKLSQRNDEVTYTMSNMCPPEAFTVLKTPNGRKISVHCESTISHPPNGPITSTPSVNMANRIPLRQNGRMYHERNNFFSILRMQGTIPSRNISEDETPKQYKYVPRVEVSAIDNSGHIDFSTISYPSPSQPRPTTSPRPHIAIEMDDIDFSSSRSHSRAEGEPSTPTTSEPMIQNNIDEHL